MIVCQLQKEKSSQRKVLGSFLLKIKFNLKKDGNLMINLTSEYLVERAIGFKVLDLQIEETGEDLREDLYIKKVPRGDGGVPRWSIFNTFDWAISKKAAKKFSKLKKVDQNSYCKLFIHVGLPSGRKEVMLKDIRFDTLEEAFEVFQSIKENYIKSMKARYERKEFSIRVME
jgi:hypothetical protein